MIGHKPRAKRITVNHEFASLEEFVHDYVANVSTTGAFICSDSPLPVGSTIDLRFSILAEDVHVIEGVGKVVRVQRKPRGMGVRFTLLTTASRGLLAKLLAKP